MDVVADLDVVELNIVLGGGLSSRLFIVFICIYYSQVLHVHVCTPDVTLPAAVALCYASGP